MAGDSVIGALRVILGLDTGAFEDGAKRATQSADSLAKKLGTIAGGIQLQKVIEGLVKGFVDLAKSGFETADAMGKMAQKVGIPDEKLSALAYVADLSGVSLETLSKSTGIISKKLAAASAGTTDKAAATFKALAIATKDASRQIKSADQIIAEVTSKLGQMEDGVTKTALAVAIFGRGGAEMVPLLNQGAAAITSLTKEAAAFGLVITKDTFIAAEKFNDSLRSLGMIPKGVALVLTAAFAPALANVVERMKEWAIENQIVQRTADVLARTVRFLADNVQVLITYFTIFVGLKIAQLVLGATVAFIAFARAMQAATFASLALNAAKKLTIGKIAVFATVIALATGTLPLFTSALEPVGDTIAKILPEETTAPILKFLKQAGFDTKAFTDQANELANAINKGFGKDTKDKLNVKFDPEGSKNAKQFA